MSTLLILSAVLLVVMCFAYLSLQTHNSKNGHDEVPKFKKGVDYETESRILYQMAREREIQMQRTSKPKVSVHLDRSCGSIHSLEPLVRRLRETVELYFVVESDFAKEVEQLSVGKQSSRVFKCSTQAGSLALIRQLSASAHIETSPEYLVALRKYLPRIVSLNHIVKELEEITPIEDNKLDGIVGYDRLEDTFQSLILCWSNGT